MLLWVVVLVLLCLLEWLLFAVLVCVVCLVVDCMLGLLIVALLLHYMGYLWGGLSWWVLAAFALLRVCYLVLS